MENLIQYKGIMFGFTNYGADLRIMALQDGESKTSLANVSFNAGETVVKFIIFKNVLFALIKGTVAGRILKLVTINSGAADTWEEVVGL